MWGALGGAVVAAFAAWLFSLDLRRREREDRKQEREQDRLDRQTERADAPINVQPGKQGSARAVLNKKSSAHMNTSCGCAICGRTCSSG